MKTKKKPVKTLTKEEEIRLGLERDLNELNRTIQFIPEPTYFFNVGDYATIGRLKNVIVEEVLYGGKIYKIDYTIVEDKYGEEVVSHHNKLYVKWLDIRTPNNNTASLIKNSDLRLNYHQTQLTDILSKAYFFGTDMDPDYQREYVWEESDKVALIDSIFKHIDIGKFLFNDLGYNSEKCYEIIDGKQRMRAILDFYENKFAYNGYKYNDLSLRDQSYFKGYMLNIATLERASKEQILRYFLMVNRSGRIMDKSHLNKVEDMLNTIKKDD